MSDHLRKEVGSNPNAGQIFNAAYSKVDNLFEELDELRRNACEGDLRRIKPEVPGTDLFFRSSEGNGANTLYITFQGVAIPLLSRHRTWDSRHGGAYIPGSVSAHRRDEHPGDYLIERTRTPVSGKIIFALGNTGIKGSSSGSNGEPVGKTKEPLSAGTPLGKFPYDDRVRAAIIYRHISDKAYAIECIAYGEMDPSKTFEDLAIRLVVPRAARQNRS